MLLQEHKDLFLDIPTTTNRIYNDVNVGDVVPVEQLLYRLNSSKQQYLKEDIICECVHWTK